MRTLNKSIRAATACSLRCALHPNPPAKRCVGGADGKLRRLAQRTQRVSQAACEPPKRFRRDWYAHHVVSRRVRRPQPCLRPAREATCRPSMHYCALAQTQTRPTCMGRLPSTAHATTVRLSSALPLSVHGCFFRSHFCSSAADAVRWHTVARERPRHFASDIYCRAERALGSRKRMGSIFKRGSSRVGSSSSTVNSGTCSASSGSAICASRRTSARFRVSRGRFYCGSSNFTRRSVATCSLCSRLAAPIN